MWQYFGLVPAVLFLLVFSTDFEADAQVFMRMPQLAPTLGMGGAAVAYPSLNAGVGQEAALGLGESSGVWMGTTLPYGLTGWQSLRLTAILRTSHRDGLGLDVAHSGIEAYDEQRLRLLYGRRLSRALLIGASADILRVLAREYGQSTKATFSLSALTNPIPELWLGAQVYNPIQIEVSGIAIPAVLRLGAAWNASSTFIASLEIEKDLERPTQFRLGTIYRPLHALALRLGARGEPLCLAIGADVRIAYGLILHTAAEWHTALGVTPAFAVAWQRPPSTR
ncbi:MAG: hypothetical protein NZM43_01225 [Saprospiraceae bacterium]|nr:hypothetical protein [Saprospiraceae bacterium]MDW8482921.1 hypothetical protein [Saprospiraceae bacterium]